MSLGEAVERSGEARAERRLDPERLPGLLDRLHSAAWALCGSPDEADDLVQETFARVLGQPRVLRLDDPLPYLLRALRNTYLTSLRTASRRPRTVQLPSDDSAVLGSALARPEVALEQRATLDAIAALPDAFRAALVAVDVLGLSYHEAACALGAREATITTRLSRARLRVARTVRRDHDMREGGKDRPAAGVCEGEGAAQPAVPDRHPRARGGRVSASIAAARELPGFHGRLIGPDDAGYEEARSVYNAMIDKRPALLARCADADDVAATVRFAHERDLLLAVRGGGHNGAGLGTCDDGVVIDLAPLDDVEVDPQARTVRVGGGATWGEVDRRTNEHGLATPSGIISTTGVGGLTLGGGIGHLTRMFGLTIDNLLEAEMVLASGERVRASAERHPDLYWAIRGGGGNFGVVTSFLFRLHDVGTVIGGPTFWPVEAGAEALAAYREFLPDAPRELNGFFAFHTVPPAPPFPEEIHLREVCGVVWCYVGSDEAAAAEAMAPLLDALPEPLLHGPAPMPHPALQSAFDGLYPPGDQWYWRADFVNEISDAAVRLHARFGAEMPTMKSTMHMYPIDGAAHDRSPSDTAWSYRDAQWASVFAGVDPDPANGSAIRDWSVGYFDALHAYSAGGAYVNMMMDEGQERVRASYRDNYDRLARVKAVYDPDNLFRVNQNIEPGGAPAE